MMTIEHVVRCVQTIFGPLRPSDGVSEEEILTAEHRMKASLPNAIRTLYRQLGKHAMHEYGSRMVDIQELEILDGMLKICVEEQGVTNWAIAGDSHIPDPPVLSYEIENGREVYVPEFASFSEFACFLVSWKVAAGALPAVGIRTADDGQNAEPIANLESVGELMVQTDGAHIRCESGGIVVMQPDGYLLIGAQTKDAFERIADRMGVLHWEYLSWRDG
ncbi:MAG: hypothetical protein ACKV2T_17800 [Kofleriaceae bacterium]